MTTPAHWQKSSFSGGGEGNDCVELAATTGDHLRLRESDEPGTELTMAAAPLAHLIRGVKAGLFRTTA
ncbi:DUF397 domain-containing protein [Streptomyces sp. NPDC050704]|uniref:DUF397 domain-containing protein n=1 Tax=Streptomyces sp. NPDC050704 TaxID=3157219 RepID=UPI00342CDFC8